MSLLEDVKEKVPQRFHTEPDFQALVDMVRLNRFDSKEKLIDYLDKEISEIEKWIQENRVTGGTIVKDLRDKTIRLGTLKSAKKYIGEYL